MSLQALTVQSNSKDQVIDITSLVEENLTEGEGVATVFVSHTTCAVTACDLDPGTNLDLLDVLKKLLPEISYRHPHDPSHTPDHMLSAIIGPSLTVPFQNGKLVLGTWQRIILIELNGPKERKVYIEYR